MAEVFISYARADKGFVRDIHGVLLKLNRDTWIDWRSIPDSAKWRAEIFAGIEAADNFLFIISPDSVKSWMCGQEVSHAVANNKRLITILYHSVEGKELLPALSEVQWIDFQELGFEQSFERLTAAIDSDLKWVRKHTQFLVRATEWESKDYDQGFLLHGMEFKEAVRWLEQAAAVKGRKPTELQGLYIRASEEWEANEIRRLKDLTEEKERQRQEAERQRQNAEKAGRVAVARELVAFSALSLEDDVERSILLAMHAVDATHSVDRAAIPEAEDALHRAILRSRIRLTLTGHTDWVNAVAVTPDGKQAVSASEDKTLKVWDLGSGRGVRTLAGHSSWVHAVALMPNGKQAVSASEDKTLKVWELESGRELRTLQGNSNAVLDVAVSGDGRLAVSASWDKTLKVWEVESGRELRTLGGHSAAVYDVALSADGRLVVSASHDKTVKVWELASGCELRTLSGHESEVEGVALTADGRLAVSASLDKTLKVWEVENGRELHILTGHSGPVRGVAVSPDSRRVASASDDKTVRIWDLESGRELITLAAHSEDVRSVAWTPNGKRLLSAGEDRIIQVYAMDIDLLLPLARSRVTRNLTPEECRKYLHLDEVPPIP
jgi:WD40 repeat protein